MFSSSPILLYFQYRVIETLFVYGMKWFNKKMDYSKSIDQSEKKDKSTLANGLEQIQ